MKLPSVVMIAAASVSILPPSSPAQAIEKLSVLQVSVEGPLGAIINERITWNLSGKRERATHFHVRAFKGDLRYNTTTMKTYADKNGCIPYHTWVLNAEANGELHIDPLTDIGMLTQDDHGNFSDGNLTLVFEAANSGTLQDIRLHKSQLPAYFRHAKELVVSPNDWARSLSPAIAARIVDAMARQRESTKSGPTASGPQTVELPNVPCYNSVVEIAKEAGKSPDEKSSVAEVAQLQPGPCGSHRR